MSFVWSAEQIKRYFAYYEGINTRNTYNYLTFETTREFARSVLPPCFEVCDKPEISISSMAFMEVIDGRTNRHGRDRAGIVSINARYGDRVGSYYLSVIEEEEVNIATGREFWGMAKKQGVVDTFDDGRTLWSFVERKGHRLIEIEAELGPELGEQEAAIDYYFELRGYFGPNGRSLSGVQVVVFEINTKTNRFRELNDPHVALAGSDVDPGIGTIPLGAFVGGGATGGELSATLAAVDPLDDDGNDYAPYLLARFYDDWPDYRDDSNRRSN
ncbi:hypothetical protein CIW52_11210 [Mycolicibacterium sp. P9-64]|uniref:acetoacetate decarboxylase family protein n=1 Tax=Mycolicibacterium sp. P9-64 TaxID=2024612 RepID=UPI0011EF1598|nr:acetoacetate decarboxylase family protein [Mycolicibacterium sp. P9-64]KAA0084560.1 hypothetical protein CIW52_11210 [Mycolicibacterium sp. P9-64]